jgi:DNA-binding transcriptional LysR family regulator
MQLWDLNLRHLRAVAAVAEHGSISAAGERIGLTQPAITQALRRLEALLDIELFERRSTGMAPTEAAKLLVPRIDAALALIGSPRVTAAQMRALLAVASAGSYAGAASATGLSQPSLHRAIGDLGVALRRPLVERRGRGLALTEAGLRTVRAFRRARAELDAALDELATLKGRDTGRMAIGAMPLCRARLLPTALNAFRRARPGAAVKVVEGSWGDLIEPLRDGDIDLMIGAMREPGAGDDLEQTPLFSDRPVILGRTGHPLAGENRPDLATLAKYQWVVPAPAAPLRRQWQRMFDTGGVTAPSVPIECGSVITIRQLLLESDLLTVLSPDQVALELGAGWLTVIRETPTDFVRHIGLITRSDWRPTPTQREFVRLLRGIAAQDGPLS